MPVIKNVAIVGASGRLGKAVLNALITSQRFNTTVLTQESTTTVFPAGVQVIPVDYESIPSICEALCGHEAVIITVGMDGLAGQSLIVDAAIVSGIRRIIPSEFGFNTDIPKTAALPIFAPKVTARSYIEEKIAAGAKITYTYILNGPFLDWGLETGILLGLKDGKPTLYDGGVKEFSAASLASVGQAVVGVLVNEEETRNRSVFVQDIVTSQLRLLELAMEAKPTLKWEPVFESLSTVEERLRAGLERGDWRNFYEYLYLATFGDGYGAKMERVDNELLGVKGLDENDVLEMWRKVLG